MINTAELQSTFNKNLNDLIKRKGLNQTKLAEMTGISQQSISTYCKNNGAVLPDIPNVAKIANALQVSIDSLLGLDTTVAFVQNKKISLSEYLRALVIVADSLNFRVDAKGCYRNEESLGLPYEYEELLTEEFFEAWARYRKLLEETAMVQLEDYKTLVESHLNRIAQIEIAESEALNAYLSQKRKI